MGYLIMATDPLHTDFSAEEAECARVGAEFRAAQCRTEAEVARACRDADGIMVTYVPVGATALAGMPRCRVVVRTGVGYDCIDVAAATARGVMACNVPDYCTTEVADHTLALLLAWWRRIGELDAQVRREGWGPPVKPVGRLEGKTLGLLGMGRMGRAVATRARGFGLRCLGFDPYLSREGFQQAGVEPANLETLLAAADIVSVHAPLTAETHHILRAETLGRMKPTAVVVNTARGGLIALEDLAAAIREGRIAGAALDVTEPEPLPADHPIRQLPRVLLTPHAAWYSTEAEPELRRRSTQIVIQALQGQRPASLLNPEVPAR